MEQKDLTDAELVALAALVNADVSFIQAENLQAASVDRPVSYPDGNLMDRLYVELRRRGILT